MRSLPKEIPKELENDKMYRTGAAGMSNTTSVVRKMEALLSCYCM
jgi:hypothetical protein